LKKRISKILFGNDILLNTKDSIYFNYYIQPEEYNIKFNGKIVCSAVPYGKTYSKIWYFIEQACINYNSVKGIKRPINNLVLEKFNDSHELVSFVEIEENGIKKSVYKNFFSTQESKGFREKIVEVANELNYPTLILEVISFYSQMLIMDEDPYLDGEDRLDILNVDLNQFISTEEQLLIFIEALELELQNSSNPNFFYRSYIEKLIKNLKTQQNMKYFAGFLKGIRKIFNICFFIFSPILMYSFFQYINTLIPSILILILFYNLLKHSLKLFYPFYQKGLYYEGILHCLKTILYYFWFQKLIILGSFFIPYFFFYQSLFKTFLNFNFLFYGKVNIFSYMLPTLKRMQKSSFIIFKDVATSLNIIKDQNLTLQKKKEAGLFIYRGWLKDTQFFKRLHNCVFKWDFEKQKGELTRLSYYEKIAAMEASPLQNFGLGVQALNFERLLLNDNGHSNIIRGDEPFVALLLAQTS
jgi:hypothetical protein